MTANITAQRDVFDTVELQRLLPNSAETQAELVDLLRNLFPNLAQAIIAADAAANAEQATAPPVSTVQSADTAADIAELVAMAGPSIQVGGPPRTSRQQRAHSIGVFITRPQVERIRRKRYEEQTVKTAIAMTVQQIRAALARTLSVLSPEIQELIVRLEGNLDTWLSLQQELHNDLNTYLLQVQMDLGRLREATVTGCTCLELGSMMSLLATMATTTVAGIEQILPPPLDAANITVEMQGPHVQIVVGNDKLMSLVSNLTGYKGGGAHYLRNVLRCTARGGGRPFIESLIEQAMLMQEPQAIVPDHVRSIQLSPRNTNATPVIEPAGADSTVFAGTAGDDEAADYPPPVV